MRVEVLTIAYPSGVFFTLFLRSFILLRELEYVVEPPWSEAVQKATNGARGGLPVLQYTRKHGLVRERRVCVSSGTSKACDRFQIIAIVSVIPDMVKAGYRG
jgi:hypothetical protein